MGSEEIAPWLKVSEKVVWASGRVPLLVSYNEELRRSAFHVLLANTAEVAREAQVAFVPTHSYSLKGLAESPHHEVVTQLVFEEGGEGEAVVEVVLNRSVKRGQVVVYARTLAGEVKVYELDFYGSHSATRLVTKVAHVGGLVGAALYCGEALQLEEAGAVEGSLLNELLKEQLAGLADCVALLHETFIGYYHNGFLIATQPLSKFVAPVGIKEGGLVDGEGKKVHLVPLVTDGFDGMVLRTLELVL